jgi:hypothetical protein
MSKYTDTKLNMEDDIKLSSKMMEKILDKTYAQNLYAAMCNNAWQKKEVWEILNNYVWTVSFRQAGAILAKLRGQGDYLDYYCSQLMAEREDDYVPEGKIIDEIKTDLKEIGWIDVPEVFNDDN